MSARGVVATQRGSIPISWTRGRGQFSLDVTVPANMTASVSVPATRADAVRENGRALDGAPGVMSVRAGAGTVVIEIGSGHYAFRAG